MDVPGSSPWGRRSLTNVGRGEGRGAKPQALYWQFNVLDTRQYRDEQARNPKRTLTGEEQERWLFDSLDRSSSTWEVFAQQAFGSRHSNTSDDSAGAWSSAAVS